MRMKCQWNGYRIEIVYLVYGKTVDSAQMCDRFLSATTYHIHTLLDNGKRVPISDILFSERSRPDLIANSLFGTLKATFTFWKIGALNIDRTYPTLVRTQRCYSLRYTLSNTSGGEGFRY